MPKREHHSKEKEQHVPNPRGRGELGRGEPLPADSLVRANT